MVGIRKTSKSAILAVVFILLFLVGVMPKSNEAFASPKIVTTKSQIQHAAYKMSLRLAVINKQLDDLQNIDDQCGMRAQTDVTIVCTIPPLEGLLGVEQDDLNSAILAGSRALFLKGVAEDAYLRAFDFQVASDYISNEAEKSLGDISASEVAEVALAQSLIPYANSLQNSMNNNLLNSFLKKLNWVIQPSDKTNMLRILRIYAFMK